ncbi:MAG: shikimate kinase [Deltaproteobacteria bacterium]|nr:shikimate kinase [Deltaproteobacteria bacterium]
MADKRNIVLTGPSGSGKSTVGILVANALERSFVDMDKELEKRFDCEINDFFASNGEEAFRDAESELVLELAAKEGLVIATGGGVLIRKDNRDALESSSVTVNLHASVDALLERLAGHEDRPLLHGNARTKLKALLDERRALYEAVDIQVDTEGKDPENVALEIVAMVEDGAG